MNQSDPEQEVEHTTDARLRLQLEFFNIDTQLT